jgi:lipoprotein-anchoring transpeptidase ErfK/SrfK
VRTRSFIAVVVLLAALFAGAAAVYAYDHGREDKLAEGIRVGGLDVGGMKRSAAESKLRAELSARYKRPIVAAYENKRFTLSARQAGITFNVRGAIDEAIRRSREGNILTRTYHGLSGRRVDADISPHVGYSARAVDAYLRQIARHVARKAKNASLDFAGAAPEPRKGKEGVALDSAALRRDVSAMVTGQAPPRVLQVHARTFKPKVTLAKLSREYPKLIIVNRSAFTLTMYNDLKQTKSYHVAVGQVGLETPAGLYHIQNKQVDPAWSVPNSAWAGALAGHVIPGGTPQNPLKARWMGIFDGAGIHGTDNIGSLGSAASHGCVRMAIPDVIDLYDRVDVGTPVYIA